jgi:hypothetical protein
MRDRAPALGALLAAGALLLGAAWAHPGGGADGNRVAPGRGAFPGWRELALPGAVPAWMVTPGPGRLVAIDATGAFTVYRLTPDVLDVLARFEGAGALNAAPVGVRLGSGVTGAVFVTREGRLAVWREPGATVYDLPVILSVLTHPTAVDVDGDGRDELLAITSDGSIALVAGLPDAVRVLDRLAIGALPDARVSVTPDGEALVLTQPTTRYAHGVFGDTVEASAVTAVRVAARTLSLSGLLRLRPDLVVEDRRIVVADVDRDGTADAVMTRAALTQGASVLALTRVEGRWDLLALGRPIGQARRWEHTIGVADLDGSGATVVSVRTPHGGGTLQALRRKGGALEIIARRPGVNSHVLGSRNLDQAVIADLDGNGRPEVVIPGPARDALLGVELAGTRFVDRWRLPLGGPVISNLVVADLDGDGRLDLAVADATGLRVFLSVKEAP